MSYLIVVEDDADSEQGSMTMLLETYGEEFLSFVREAVELHGMARELEKSEKAAAAKAAVEVEKKAAAKSLARALEQRATSLDALFAGT